MTDSQFSDFMAKIQAGVITNDSIKRLNGKSNEEDDDEDDEDVENENGD